MKNFLAIVFFSLLLSNISLAESIEDLRTQAIDAGVKILNQDDSAKAELVMIIEKAQTIKIEEVTKEEAGIIGQIAQLGLELL